MPPFSKPKAQGDSFSFQVPDKLGGRGRIPAGKDYLGRLTSVEADTSQAGNPMWVWTFIVVKGPHAGRDFKLWTVLNDDSAWKVVETLKSLGVQAEAGEEVRFEKKKVIGVCVRLQIVDDEYNGREQSKLQSIYPHPNGAGYRGKFADEEVTPIDQQDGGEEEVEEEVEQEEEREEKVKKPKPAPSKSGKAPATLGKKRR